MKQFGALSIPVELSDFLDPSRTALIIYDMQVGICRQVADAPAVVSRIQALLDCARGAGIRVGYTRHFSLPLAWTGSTQMRTAMAWQRVDDPAAVTPWFLRDDQSVEIVPDLAPRPDEAIFDKVAMSAFEGTSLATALRDCDIRSVIFCGIATEIGIEPSCRHAVDLGFVPILALDACGHGHADAAQRSVDSLRFAGDTIVTDVETICGLIGAAKTRAPLI